MRVIIKSRSLLRLLTVTVFFCITSSAVSQRIQTDFSVNTNGLSLIKSIDLDNPDKSNFHTRTVVRPHLEATAWYTFKRGIGLGLGISYMQNARYVGFEFTNSFDFGLATTYGNVIEQRYLGLSANVRRDIGQWRAMLSLHALRELNWKNRIESDGEWDYLVVRLRSISPDADITQIGGYGTVTPSLDQSVSTAVVSLKMDRQLLSGLYVGAQFVYRHKSQARLLISYETYEVTDLTEVAETLSRDDTRSSRATVRQDHLELRIGLTYTIGKDLKRLDER